MPPIGVAKWFAKSDDWSEIEQHLVDIRIRAATNGRQFNFMSQRVDRIIKRKSREPMVRRMISTLREEIFKLPEIDIVHECNLDNHDKWAVILKEGLAQLNAIKSQSESKILEQQQAEADAITADKMKLDRMLAQQRAQIPVPPKVERIRLYRMNDPLKDPHELDCNWKVYSELIYYLTTKKIASKPELWIRRDAVHTLTPTGRTWEFAKMRSEIEDKDLDVLDRESTTDYIIALVHENQQEIPAPIELAQYTAESDCETLKARLERIWTSRVVVSARLFSNPTDYKVLNDPLDTSIWTPRTNDLYLRVEPRQQ